MPAGQQDTARISGECLYFVRSVWSYYAVAHGPEVQLAFRRLHFVQQQIPFRECRSSEIESLKRSAKIRAEKLTAINTTQTTPDGREQPCITAA